MGRLCHDLFRAPLPIHLCGINQSHSKIQTKPQSGNLRETPGPIFSHSPGALSENRDQSPRRQAQCSHFRLIFRKSSNPAPKLISFATAFAFEGSWKVGTCQWTTTISREV